MKCSKTKIRGGLNEQIFVTTNNPTGSASKYKDTIGGYGLPFKSSSEIERCENMRRPATYFVTYFMSFHILRPPFNSYCVTDRLANMAQQGATKVSYRTIWSYPWKFPSAYNMTDFSSLIYQIWGTKYHLSTQKQPTRSRSGEITMIYDKIKSRSGVVLGT